MNQPLLIFSEVAFVRAVLVDLVLYKRVAQGIDSSGSQVQDWFVKEEIVRSVQKDISIGVGQIGIVW